MNKELMESIVNHYQDDLGLRVCPLNICNDDNAKAICCIKNGSVHCRKRFWTCWKEYFKKGEENGETKNES